MKQRLFWKILLGFWATYLLISLSLWTIFVAYGQGARRHAIEIERDFGRSHIVAAQTAYQYGGLAAVQTLLGRWPAVEREQFVLASDGAPTSARPALIRERLAGNGGGAVILFTPDWDTEHDPHLPHGFLNIPPEVMFMEGIGGLGFSFVLAWYLTRPIHRLRSGFAQLARGDLSVRLAGQMGRRRDEIADLAGDFDLMAARLQSLIGARDQLLHDVSHELRSPLARLRIAIDLARQDPRRLQSALRKVETESDRLDTMVGELLTLSRAESGAGLDGYLDIESLVGVVAEDAGFEAASIEVTVKSVVGAGADGGRAPMVRGDAELLRRGLDNVVRNALRFSPPHGTVEIRLSRRDEAGRYLIEVTDEGPGIPETDLAAIFEPFVRLSHQASRQEKSAGLGLGLSIARRAFLAHGGAVTARNRAPGGLCVEIRLPYIQG